MSRFLLKAAWLAFFSPLCAAQAFDAVDTLTPAGSGIYPAYPSEVIRPYEFWAQFGMLYDSNVLRRTVGDNHELVSRLGLGGRWDQRVVGRQSVHLEGRLDGYGYGKNSAVDNTGYARGGGGGSPTGAGRPFVRAPGRGGRPQRQSPERRGRDFNGPTWTLLFQWLPSAKTVFGVETSKHVSSIIDIGASHIVAKDVSFGPGWAPTAKLNFQARMIRQHQVFEGDPAAALGVAPLRQEFIPGYRLGSYWE